MSAESITSSAAEPQGPLAEPPWDHDDLPQHEPPNETRTGGSCKFETPLRPFVCRTRTLISQLTYSEISGSLGDLGTLIPLVVSMARQGSILLAPALFFSGLANVVTGYAWDVPMAVQPMKSIAAVALSESLSREAVTSAGILTGAMILVIGATNFIELVNKIVPLPVVSGLQIGVGLRLASKGIQGIQQLGWVDGWDCILLAVVVSVLCLYWLRENGAPGAGGSNAVGRVDGRSAVDGPKKCGMGLLRNLLCCFRRPFGKDHPVGVYLFLIGAIFAAVELSTTENADGSYDLPLRLFGAPVAVWAMDTVTAVDWKVGFLEGAIPQLPLTTLNSVISVCCLAHSLYPEKRRSTNSTKNDAVLSRREVCISVGLMNVLCCPFGGMPNCHGAGGLAGQHRFGARHGASVVFLGLAKVLLAVFFGSSLLTLLNAFPRAVLGVMLAIAGQELATTGFTLLAASAEEAAAATDGDDGKTTKKRALRKSTVIATITAMVIVALGKTQYGALSGWVAHMVYGNGTADFVRWFHRWKDGWGRDHPSADDSSASPDDHNSSSTPGGSSEDVQEEGRS